jgi:type I restriction enzyme S subunit
VGSHDRSLVAGPVVVVGRKGTAGSVIWVGRDAWPIDTTFFAQPQDGCDPVFVYYFLLHANLPHLTADSAVPGLNRDTAERQPVALPPPEWIAEFAQDAGPLFTLKGGRETERQTLTEVRDLLLPKLISGEIRVPDTADPEEVIAPAAEKLAGAPR